MVLAGLPVQSGALRVLPVAWPLMPHSARSTPKTISAWHLVLLLRRIVSAVRLSVLMAAAKLPRVEMAWDDDRESPIFLRFSGGRGIIAHDRNLSGTVPARSLHQGTRDALRPGAAMSRPIRSTGNLAKPPPPEPMLDDWPPADFS